MLQTSASCRASGSDPAPALRESIVSLISLRYPGFIVTAVLVIVLPLAGAGAGAAKPDGQPRLNVVKLSRPPASKVLVGDRVKLEAEVRNAGRKAGRSKVKLIVPERKGATKGRKLDSFPVKRFAPKSVSGFRFDFEVDQRLAPPEGALSTEHRLAVCVRAHGEGSKFRCKETKRPLRVGIEPLPPDFEPGGRSAGDPLFPQTGNTGYDVSGYAIDLSYNPAGNRLLDGTKTRISATSTQDLGQFSLDFQDLDVSSVKVDGEPAAFDQVAARPALESGTELMKLVIQPAAGIPEGQPFDVVVRYSGTGVEIVDPDGSSEGWVRACIGVPSPVTCDGALVLNEPNGAQGWFPNNNHPSDKATFTTAIEVPSTHVALGIGELASRESLPGGRERWTWVEDDPTATYLTTATVGEFDYTESTMQETGAGRTLPVYTAIDSDASGLGSINAALARSEGMVNFLAGAYGSYPFDSGGAIVDIVPTLGYALEVQTKPAFATPSVPVSTLLHEWAHQWFGDAVSPASWLEIWFNEGWAAWSEWYWGFEENGETNSPADEFQDRYDNASDEDWSIPPATLNGDPANLFENFPVYVRSAMTLEGYRQIVGDAKFLEFARELQTRFGYGNVSTAQVIALAKEISAFAGPDLDLLDQYFQQWLYGSVKPTILPSSF